MIEQNQSTEMPKCGSIINHGMCKCYSAYHKKLEAVARAAEAHRKRCKGDDISPLDLALEYLRDSE